MSIFMIMVVVVVVALALVPVTGGDLRRLGQVRFRGVAFLAISLLAQVLVLAVFDAHNPTQRGWFGVVHTLSYLLAFCFVLLNWRIPGMVLLGAGGLSNGVTIALNQGTLPASAQALQRAGINPTPTGFSNSAAMPHPTFAALGDIWAIPQGWPFANVFSIGDVLIWLGVVVALYGICVAPHRRAHAPDTRHTNVDPELSGPGPCVGAQKKSPGEDGH